MREPELKGADALSAAYEAKAGAELEDADAAAGVAPGGWEGATVGSRIAFVVGSPPDVTGDPGLLDARTADAVAKAGEALGAAGEVFIIGSGPTAGVPAADRASRLRLALEAVDVPAVIALDARAAADLAAAFGLEGLPPGVPVVALGRAIGSVGEFAASLDDSAAKARAWAAMKAVALAAGLQAKTRQKKG